MTIVIATYLPLAFFFGEISLDREKQVCRSRISQQENRTVRIMAAQSTSDHPMDPPDDKPTKTATGAKEPETSKKPNDQEGKKPAAEPSEKVSETKGNNKRPADDDPKESSAKKQKVQGGRIQPRCDLKYYEADAVTRY